MAYTQLAPRSRYVLGAANGTGPALVADVTRTGSWLGRRHSLKIEAAVVVLLYAVYDASRGLVGGGRTAAITHAQMVASWERGASIGIERGVQRLAGDVPGLMDLFGWGYMTLHLGTTAAVLLWLHRRRSERAYASIRTALLVASGLGLVGFVLFPTAPPRVATAGIADTVSHAAVNLNSTTLHWLYNPYAAMPSMHMAYAAVVGFSVARWGPSRPWRLLGWLYPIWVGVEVVGTGNHFVIDVLSGLVVAAAALFAASILASRVASPASHQPARTIESTRALAA